MKNVQEMLASAYATLRSDAVTKSISALTLDHLIQERIDSIRGKKLSDLDAMKKDVDDVVSAAQKTESA